MDAMNNNRSRGLVDLTNRVPVATGDRAKEVKKAHEDILVVPLRPVWGMEKREFLFPPGVLSELESVGRWADHLGKEDLALRPLKAGDSRLGFLDVLAQLTTVGTVSHEDFESKLAKMAGADREWIVVVAKLGNGGVEERVVATATLTLEEKFIHSASSRSRVEDVCVDSAFRDLKLGRILLEVLVELAKTLGSYKCSLECKDNLVGFYEKMGFKKDEGNNFMIRRFKE